MSAWRLVDVTEVLRWCIDDLERLVESCSHSQEVLTTILRLDRCIELLYELEDDTRSGR